MIPCMGGWCTKREQCAHYYVKSKKPPAERLCEKGNDRPDPIKVAKKNEPAEANP